MLPLSIPKILGLDFSSALEVCPIFLELNRTPTGLVRGNADGAVKEAVVDAAWSLWNGATCEDTALDALSGCVDVYLVHDI